MNLEIPKVKVVDSLPLLLSKVEYSKKNTITVLNYVYSFRKSCHYCVSSTNYFIVVISKG